MFKSLVIAGLSLALSACGLNDPRSGRGFRLPDGNVEQGKQAFVDLSCHGCHAVEGVDAKSTGTARTMVALGGDVTTVRTYGDLVTAIINPSHKLAIGTDPSEVAPAGQSLMEGAALNDRMTVRQLIDLVAFLQKTYKVVPPTHNPYSRIYP
jgi:sulfur-oxidizing protein SoxX